jgi:hypothetical protein
MRHLVRHKPWPKGCHFQASSRQDRHFYEVIRASLPRVGFVHEVTTASHSGCQPSVLPTTHLSTPHSSTNEQKWMKDDVWKLITRARGMTTSPNSTTIENRDLYGFQVVVYLLKALGGQAMACRWWKSWFVKFWEFEIRKFGGPVGGGRVGSGCLGGGWLGFGTTGPVHLYMQGWKFPVAILPWATRLSL